MAEYVTGLVSVIIPVYKVEMFIETTISSVLSQTYPDFEIVVVDDCSPDRSLEIVQRMQKEYSQIRIHSLAQNSGVAVARNAAMDLARGQYVAFLDGDDAWFPEKLEKQITLLHEKAGSFSFTAIEMIDEKGTVVKDKRKIVPAVNYKYLLHNTMIATSSVLVDRALTGAFHMPLRRSGQDYATWLMLLRKGNVAYGVDEALVQYRRTEGSLSSNKAKNIRKVWDIQVQYEGISRFAATFHSLCYAWNGVKKYFF